MRTVRELVWLTQLGFSIVCPLVLCLFGAIWLRDRFGLGNWVLFRHCPGIGRCIFPRRRPLHGCQLFKPPLAGEAYSSKETSHIL